MILTMPTFEKSWTIYALLYFGLIFSGFFWAVTDVHRDILYIGGIVGVIFSIVGACKKKLVIDFGFVKQPLFILAALFLSYSTLTILWSDPDSSARVVKFLKNFFILPLFLFLYVASLQANKNLYRVLVTVFLGSAALSGLYILLNHYVLNEMPSMRLRGVGRVENPIALGLMCSIAALFLLFPDKSFYDVLKKPVVRIIGILLFLTVLFLCLSRGPILAFGTTFFILLVLNKKYWTAVGLFLVGLCIIGGFIISADWSNTNFLERGSSGRLSAWIQGVDQIQEKPLFGHGVATKMTYQVPYMNHITTASHVHNIYLSHFIQGGVIGVLLLLGTFGFALKNAWNLKRNYHYNSVFSIMLITAILGVVDFGGFHTSMGTTWFVFWMPIAFLLAHYALLNKSSH